MHCSCVKIKKEEEPEDSKVDIKVEPKSSFHHHYWTSSSTTNDIKPVIIKHEINKEEYDSDCDCNDCRVAQGKVIKIVKNVVVQSTTQNQTDKHNDDCGCNDFVQGRQVGDQVTDQTHQVTNDRTVDFTELPTGDNASRSSTPDWMPSIFSDNNETEDDDETIQDEDDTQEENDVNQTRVPVKKERKSQTSMEAVYRCLAEGCTKAFKDNYKLKQHQTVHTGERLGCKQCKSKFFQNGELKRHVQNVHQKTKQWRCSWPSCKHRGGYWFNMVAHVKVVHLQKSDDKSRDPGEFIKKCEEMSIEEEEESDTEVEEEKVVDHDHDDDSKRKTRFITIHLNCLDCTKTFKTRKDLKRHELMAHKIQQFRCVVKDCLASFENSYKFQKHISVKHRNCRMWSCRECDHQLKTYLDLIKHFKIKHQKGRFACAHTHCTVEANTSNDIVAHHLSVHQPTKHRCSRCKKRFKQRKDLLEHERQHTGDRPFGCTLCDKRYTANKELNKHIRAKHQSQKPYRCKWDKCQYENGYINNIFKHVRVHLERAGDNREPKMFIEKHYEPIKAATAAAGSKVTNRNRSQESSNKKKMNKKKD